MGRWQLGHGDVTSSLVGDQRVFCSLLSVVSGGKLCTVTVVVAFHFVVEYFGLAGVRAGDEVLVQNAENIAANILQFFLHLESEKVSEIC